MSAVPPPYPHVEPKADYPAMERAILARWAAEGTFQATIDARPAGDNEYVFYDGPPFANGMPHYGHLLTGYVKDVIPRYQTMRGRRVERRFGWDCHGLPAEMAAEKELGVGGRKQIAEFGIARFNEHCRKSVLRYADAWEKTVGRQGRWADFANDYKTMDLSYMESVIWAFKQLWEKGLVYERYRVMPYSWGCESPLSNFEIRLDDATRPRQDPAVTVALRLDPRAGDPGPLDLLIWTTTPWTLPSNLGVAVGPDLDYVVVRLGERFVVLGAEALPAYAKDWQDHEVVARFVGRDFVGRTYEPLFPFFRGHRNAFRVFAAPFVETGEGTAIVHMAPYGEDDQIVLEGNGVVLVDPVDERGCFTDEVPPYAGQNVFEANKAILRDLKQRGVLLKHETIVHNYPHCYRTDTPIIYKPLKSWYVEVTRLRARMLELNQEIHWIPEHVRDGQFGRWLEGARDWSISRNRFWGAPIPVWRSDDPAHPRVDVYGSLDEIERDFGVRPTDLHRPTVDELVRPNPDDPTGRSMMRRVPEVLDCWFESGSMPFAQVHYPFENRDWFDSHFPADFIVEYIAQTRGWFYTMVVLSTALFDRPPFRHCMCHGVVQDSEGRKLSKRLRNYPEPDEVFETLGADAMRWFLMASPILRGGDLKIDQDGKAMAEVVRLVLNPIWSALHFFVLYANADGLRGTFRVDSHHRLDRYILAKTHDLVDEATRRMDAYDPSGTCAAAIAFLEALNNWYIRRSRSRFWSEAAANDGPSATSHLAAKREAYDTLYTVLTTLSRVLAPLLPFLTERLHETLVGEGSVHGADWPDAAAYPADHELVRDMDRIRSVCSAALMLREEKGLRARLPLARLSIAGAGASRLAPYLDLVRDEVNVKDVVLVDDLEAHAKRVLVPDGRVLGPRLGKQLRDVQAAAREGRYALRRDGTCEIAGLELGPADYLVRLEAKAGETSAALETNDMVVVLDTALTPALLAEGVARDVVRAVQSARKDAGLAVTDRIRLHLDMPAAAADATAVHEAFVREQVLAVSLAWGPLPDGAPHVFAGEANEVAFRGSLERAVGGRP